MLRATIWAREECMPSPRAEGGSGLTNVVTSAACWTRGLCRLSSAPAWPSGQGAPGSWLRGALETSAAEPLTAQWGGGGRGAAVRLCRSPNLGRSPPQAKTGGTSWSDDISELATAAPLGPHSADSLGAPARAASLRRRLSLAQALWFLELATAARRPGPARSAESLAAAQAR
eukprot:scaffold74387_cov57-Phaeocystis_antarctica.AAC.2